MPMGAQLALQPMQQQVQFLRAQLSASPFSAGPPKSPFLQSLGAYPQPGTIPEQHLQPVPVLVDENKQMSRKRVLLQHRLHPPIKTIKTLPHVHRFQGDKHSSGTGQTQHTAACNSCRRKAINSGDAPADRRRVPPWLQPTSAAQAGPAKAGSPATSWKAV